MLLRVQCSIRLDVVNRRSVRSAIITRVFLRNWMGRKFLGVRRSGLWRKDIVHLRDSDVNLLVLILGRLLRV